MAITWFSRSSRTRPATDASGAEPGTRYPLEGKRITAERTTLERLSRVGLFWSPTGISGPTDSFLSSGAHVAAGNWTRAMAEHGAIANVDAFAAISEIESCRQQFRGLRSGVGTGSRAVRVL